MEILKKIARLLLISYGIICFLVFFYQKKLLFFPSKQRAEIPPNSHIEEAYFTTKDNVKLHAWSLNNNSDQTVLFFHGNAGNLSHRMAQLDIFNELNLNALILDYRGYGKSNGTIKKENDLYSDGEAAYDFLVNEKKVTPSNIIIWGRSLGGSIAIHTAQNKKSAAVIVESTFFSMDRMAQSQFWFLPTKWLLKFHFRSDQKVKNINTPILIIHSPNDEVIPFINGKDLFSKANNPKEFLKISGSHNYGFQQSQKKYIQKLKDFLHFKNKS